MLERLRAKIRERDKLFEKVQIVRSFLIKPIRLVYHKRYKWNNNVAALDITYRCNMRCINCDASCGQTPSTEDMSIEQIERFVSDSIRLGKQWEVIKIRGGEPTLHPRYLDILKIIEKYVKFNPKCEIRVVTNGVGPKVNKALSKTPEYIAISNGNKEKKEGKFDYYFNTYNVAPVDLLTYKFTDFSKGCITVDSCMHVALNKYGYYPCGPGAAVDRIFGFDIGIKQLSGLTDQKLREQMKILCGYCGLFKEPIDWTKKEKMSRSWKEAYEKYKKQKPKLSLY